MPLDAVPAGSLEKPCNPAEKVPAGPPRVEGDMPLRKPLRAPKGLVVVGVRKVVMVGVGLCCVMVGG